jgi:peptide/nickel transport system permease protein
VPAQVSDVIPVPVGALRREGFLGQMQRFRQDPLGMLGLVLVVLIVLAAVFADILSPYGPAVIDVKVRLAAPSMDHLLGTDQLGRDVFSRVLHGGRIALEVAVVCISVSLGIGLVLGMLAGYGPRWLDNILILGFDAVRSFPVIMFALAVVTLVGPSLETIELIIIVTSIPGYARIVRTQTLSLKNNEFILAERSLGAGIWRVLGVHIMPNVIGPLLILGSMDVPVVVTIEAGLSFLGLGVRPPTPSWGSILNDGYAFIRNTPWLVIAGGVPLILTTLGFTFLGEALRDIIDPKLRKV